MIKRIAVKPFFLFPVIVLAILFLCSVGLQAEDYYIADDDIEGTLPLNGPITDSGKYLDANLECNWDSTGDVFDSDDPLVELARSLDFDAYKIYKWVYDNISFLGSYSGSRLGAYGTYIAGHGNEWDTSSLLIALLRISSYEARYVIYGEEDQVSVEAKLAQNNYRGHGVYESEVWTPLVPWHKSYRTVEGVELFPAMVIPAGLDFQFDEYLEDIQQNTAMELYEETIQAYLNTHHPGKTIKDLGVRKELNEYASSLLPASYPKDYDRSLTKQVFAAVPLEKRVAVTVRVREDGNDNLLLEKDIYLAEIAGKRLSLDFVPNGNTARNIINQKGGGIIANTPFGAANIKPVLKINGNVHYPGTQYFQTGDHFYVEFNGGGFENERLTKSLAGTYMYMAFDPLSASIKTIEKIKEELQELSTDLIDSDATREEYLGRAAQVMSETFLDRYFVTSEKAGNIFNGIVGWNRIFPTVMSTFPTQVGKGNVSKHLLHAVWTMDAKSKASFYHRDNDQLTKLDWNNEYFKFLRRLVSYSASYNEALVLEDWQDTPSISTIKGLMLANKEEIKICEFTNDNPEENCDLDYLNSIRYRANMNWNGLSAAEWETILDFVGVDQGWWTLGSKPAQGSEQYNHDLNYVKTSCKNGDIPTSYIEHLLTDYIPPNSLKDETVDQIIGYVNDGAEVTAPVELVPNDVVVGDIQLVEGDNFDGYFFSMRAGSIPLNGGVASEDVVEDNKHTSWDHELADVLSQYTVDDLVATYSTFDPAKGYNITSGNLNNSVHAVVSKIGDPVDMVNGEFYVTEQPDFNIKSRGLSLSIVRKYKSRSIYNGPFGYGWTWNHGQRLIPLANGDIVFYDADAKRQTIEKDGNNNYKLPEGATYTVATESVPEGWHYVFTKRDLSTYRFNQQGYLIEKADQYGNHLLFSYDDPSYKNRITSITDSIGRSLTLSYNDNGKIETVTDFSSRSCSYTYDEDDLLTVTDLESNVTTYQYLKDQENLLNNHNLSKYTLPNNDTFEISYFKNDQVSYIRNPMGEAFNFLYSRLNRYSETWNEGGYYRKVFFDENDNVTRVENEDGTIVKRKFDDHHNVTSYIDGNGYETTSDYGETPELRLLHSRTNALGETWSYEYESENNPYRPTKIINPLNQETLYTYWPSGRLHEKIVAPGYVYIDDLLIESAGAPGFITTYEYDEYGNTISVTDPSGNSSHFVYDAENMMDLTAKLDPNRHVTRFEYYNADNPENMPVGMIKSTSTEVATALSSTGYTINYEYNQYNQLTKVTDSLGHTRTQEYNQNREPTKLLLSNGAEMENIYGAARSLAGGADIVEAVDPMGTHRFFDYDERGNLITSQDGNGNVISFKYDGMNRLVKQTDPFGYAENYYYDGNGNLVSTEDKLLNEHTIVYDGAGRKISETNAKQETTHYEYDDAGFLVKIIDPRGVETYHEYDVLGRLIAKTLDYNGDDSKTYEYRYDASNRLVKEILPLGNYTYYEYDASGNTILEENYDHNGVLLQSKEYRYYDDVRNLVAEVIVDGGKDGNDENSIEFEYDDLGRKTAQIDPLGNRVETVYDEVGNPVYVSTPTGITEHIYDLNNRLIQTINPLGEATSQTYDPNGNVLTSRDAGGNITSFFYDELNRNIAVIDKLKNETLYDYDANGNLVQLTDANQGVTLFEYDELDRKKTERRPMGQETNYYYDAVGQVSAAIYGGGNKVRYDYTNTGQLEHASYYYPDDHQNPEKTVSYEYDDNGNILSYDDGTTSADYVYDELHRKTQETVNYPTFSKSYSYAYPNYWQQEFTGPDGVTVTTNYDAAGRLEDMSIPGGGMFTFSDYKWTRPQSITLPGNSATITRTYDALMRSESIEVTNSITYDQVMLREYEYSPVGEIEKKITEHGVYEYSYDAMSRLLQANNPTLPTDFVSESVQPEIGDESYSYDALGNRITDNNLPGVLTYNSNNELTSIGSTSLEYNLDGNLIDNPLAITMPQKYEYDATKRLKLIRDNNLNVVAEYYYDPFGRRLWKDVNGVRTYFMYSTEGLIAEFDSNGVELKSYGYIPGSDWTTNPMYTKAGGEYYWYINDHIGTPQKIVDTDGDVVWAARYDSFGNAVIDVGQIENNLALPGQYYDAESGLYYNWNRYYDSTIGRYIQSDPLGLDAGMNFFVYAYSNPLSFIDPMGLWGDYSDDGCGMGPEECLDATGPDDLYDCFDGGPSGPESDHDGNGRSPGPAKGSGGGGNGNGKGNGEPEQTGKDRRDKSPKKIADRFNPKKWADPEAAAIMRAQGYTNPFDTQPPSTEAPKAPNKPSTTKRSVDLSARGIMNKMKEVTSRFLGGIHKSFGSMVKGVQKIARTGPPVAKGLLFSGVVVTAPAVAIPAAEVLGPVTVTVGAAALRNPSAVVHSIDFVDGAIGPYDPHSTAAGVLGTEFSDKVVSKFLDD